jgi:betaine lipid synthase
LYLTPEGFNALKSRSGGRTQNIRLHTDTILNVLSGLGDESLTKIIVMDSLDWFNRIDPSKPIPEDRYRKTNDASPEEALDLLQSELDHEIVEMRRVLKPGGMAVWRSAGKHPWYRQRFELAGFDVQPIDIRQTGIAIDRVNMYASFYKAVWQGRD